MPRKRKGERSDGRIQIALDIGYDAEGKRLRKYFYGKTRLEAQRKKDEYLAIQTGVRHTNITVSEWIDEYLKIYPPKSNPLYSASSIVPYNRIKTALGSRLVASIREADLQKFINEMDGYSASTLSKQMQVLKKVFAKARKNRLISDDPAEDITPPDGTSGTHRTLSYNEIQLVLKYWDKTGNVGLWVMLMLFAGLRRSEMVGLDWSAVNLAERTLTVSQVGVIASNKIIIQHRTKSKAGLRVIPIADPLFNALSSVPENKRRGFVCLSIRGNALSGTAIANGIKKFISTVNRSEAGQPLIQSGKRTDLTPEPIPTFQFRCHDLRHTFCTLLYDGGVDVKTAAYLMGHSDISVTMKIYTHLSEEKRSASSGLMLDYFNRLTSI